jgi:cytochrome b involved in lipid metabolism
MKPNILVGAVVIVAVIAGIAVYISRIPASPATADNKGSQSAITATSTVSSGTPDISTSTTTTPGYTIAQVASHNSSTDCWSAIGGNVYDLTSWISRHPGGKQAIISLCGVDGSAAFTKQHGGQGRPASELATFLIGPLK